MNKNTDIKTLGSDYTVTDPLGNVIKVIQVIPYTDILDAALGPMTDKFDDVKSYLDKSISVLSGFEGIDPYSVLWYSTNSEDIVLSELITYAVKNGYDRIILEHIEESVE